MVLLAVRLALHDPLVQLHPPPVAVPLLLDQRLRLVLTFAGLAHRSQDLIISEGHFSGLGVAADSQPEVFMGHPIEVRRELVVVYLLRAAVGVVSVWVPASVVRHAARDIVVVPEPVPAAPPLADALEARDYLPPLLPRLLLFGFLRLPLLHQPLLSCSFKGPSARFVVRCDMAGQVVGPHRFGARRAFDCWVPSHSISRNYKNSNS